MDEAGGNTPAIPYGNMNEEKFNPKSPKFNWTALAQRNEDIVKETINKGRSHHDSKQERMSKRYQESDRHQAAMMAYRRKLKGSADKYSLGEMIRGELGQKG